MSKGNGQRKLAMVGTFVGFCVWVQSLGRKLFSAVTNAFNPGASGRNWVDPDIISIDLGLTTLMMENQRTGAIRATGFAVPALAHATNRVGLRKN